MGRGYEERAAAGRLGALTPRFFRDLLSSYMRWSASNKLIVVYAAANGLAFSRLGLTVGKKHGNAVKQVILQNTSAFNGSMFYIDNTTGALIPDFIAGGEHRLGVGMETDAKGVELSEVVDSVCQALTGQAIQGPDHQQVELALAGVIEHATKLSSISSTTATTLMVNVLIGDGVALLLAPPAEFLQLVLGVLAFVRGRDTGVDGSAGLCGLRHGC